MIYASYDHPSERCRFATIMLAVIAGHYPPVSSALRKSLLLKVCSQYHNVPNAEPTHPNYSSYLTANIKLVQTVRRLFTIDNRSFVTNACAPPLSVNVAPLALDHLQELPLYFQDRTISTNSYNWEGHRSNRSNRSNRKSIAN